MRRTEEEVNCLTVKRLYFHLLLLLFRLLLALELLLGVGRFKESHIGMWINVGVVL